MILLTDLFSRSQCDRCDLMTKSWWGACGFSLTKRDWTNMLVGVLSDVQNACSLHWLVKIDLEVQWSGRQIAAESTPITCFYTLSKSYSVCKYFGTCFMFILPLQDNNFLFTVHMGVCAVGPCDEKYFSFTIFFTNVLSKVSFKSS